MLELRRSVPVYVEHNRMQPWTVKAARTVVRPPPIISTSGYFPPASANEEEPDNQTTSDEPIRGQISLPRCAIPFAGHVQIRRSQLTVSMVAREATVSSSSDGQLVRHGFSQLSLSLPSLSLSLSLCLSLSLSIAVRTAFDLHPRTSSSLSL
jgi:hypothetical protein